MVAYLDQVTFTFDRLPPSLASCNLSYMIIFSYSSMEFAGVELTSRHVRAVRASWQYSTSGNVCASPILVSSAFS